MEILKRIKDNKRIGWICKLWSQPGSFLSISLNSSFESRFIVGSVEIKKKEKTAEIIDFKTKDDDADIFGLARDYSGIGLGSQIYDFLENHLKSIGIKKIYADIYYKDDKDGKDGTAIPVVMSCSFNECKMIKINTVEMQK